MGNGHLRHVGFALCSSTVLLLAGCDENGEFSLGNQQNAQSGSSELVPATRSSKTVEKDIEAPDVFQITEKGLWDGRPSLGGVWVAHPDVTDPERVIIRNTDNGKFVVGALFRRERENPGPAFQISSDAAVSLGMLAGAPAELNVTALRREEEEIEEPDPVVAEDAVEDPAPVIAEAAVTEIPETPEQPVEVDVIADAPEIEEAPLDPIATAAGAAIDVAPDDAPKAATGGFLGRLFKRKDRTEVAVVEPDALAAENIDVQTLDGTELATAEPVQLAPAPLPTPAKSRLKTPFLQVGIFSVESNAQGVADQLRGQGLVPLVRTETTNGKASWRVIVGPATTRSEQRLLLGKINGLGFTDAYAVSG